MEQYRYSVRLSRDILSPQHPSENFFAVLAVRHALLGRRGPLIDVASLRGKQKDHSTVACLLWRDYIALVCGNGNRFDSWQKPEDMVKDQHLKLFVPTDANVKLALVFTDKHESLPAFLDHVKKHLVAAGAKEPTPFATWSQDSTPVGVSFGVHTMKPAMATTYTAYYVTCIQGAAFRNISDMHKFIKDLGCKHARPICNTGFPIPSMRFAEPSFGMRDARPSCARCARLSVALCSIERLREALWERMVSLALNLASTSMGRHTGYAREL
jgi:hypothetical protein